MKRKTDMAWIRKILSAFLILTFSLTGVPPAAALRLGQFQEKKEAGLEDLKARILSPVSAPSAVSVGLEEPTLQDFQMDPAPLSLKNTRVFLPLRGPGHVKEGDSEAVFTVDDLLVAAKAIRTLNDRGVRDPHLLIPAWDRDQRQLKRFQHLTQGMDLSYVPVIFDTGNQTLLNGEGDHSPLPKGDWNPLIVEPLSRLGGFQVSSDLLRAVTDSTHSGRPPLVVNLHGFTDFQKVLVPQGREVPAAQVIDLYSEWRWGRFFKKENKQGLTGFLYDTLMLNLAEETQAQDRASRWTRARRELGPLPSDLPDGAFRIFYESQPNRVSPQQSPVELGRLLDRAKQATHDRPGDAGRILLFTSYLPEDHADWVAWHRTQGHRFEDVSGALGSFAGSANSRVTVVNLSPLPLMAQRRLMAAADLAVVSNEQTLADALYLAYRMPESAPLLFYAGINPGRLAILTNPLSYIYPNAIGFRRIDWEKARAGTFRDVNDFRVAARRPEAVETVKDLVAFEELLNGRTTKEEDRRLQGLIANPAARQRYLSEMGQTILSNGQPDLGFVGNQVQQQRAGDPTLVNGLNVLARIIERFDQALDAVQILRQKGSLGAAREYRDPSVPYSDLGTRSAVYVDSAWEDFTRTDMENMTKAERTLYFYQLGIQDLDGAGLYSDLNEVTLEDTRSLQEELPSLSEVQQVVRQHPLSAEKGAEGALLGGGGSFRAFRLPGTGAAVKYRYIHSSPHSGRMLGYAFEIQERYTTIRNTIRATIRLGLLGVPQRVFITRQLVQRYPELQRFVDMGLVEIMEEPLVVDVELQRRGLDDPDMPFEQRQAKLDTVVVQQEIHPLDKHLVGLLAEGRVDEAKGFFDRYLDLIHRGWEERIFTYDLSLSAVGLVNGTKNFEGPKIFDTGALPPLSPDTGLPDIRWNDYPIPLPEELDRSASPLADRGFLRKKIEGEDDRKIEGELGGILTALKGKLKDKLEDELKKKGIPKDEAEAQAEAQARDEAQKRHQPLMDHYRQRISEGALTPATFIRLWGTRRTDLERRQLKIILKHLPEVAEQEQVVRERLGTSPKAVAERLAAAAELRQRVPAGVDGPARVEVDLQMHTFHSDGYDTPTAVVYDAYRRGLKAVAITDHYTLEGIPEAMEAGRIFGVEVIPAVELDTETDGLEFLGYFPQFTTSGAMRDFLKSDAPEPARVMQRSHLRRAQTLLENFNASLPDLRVTADDLSKYTRSGPMLHGNVYSAFRDRAGGKDIRKVLEERGADWKPSDIQPEGWDRSPEAVLRAMRQMGAVVVMAHPAEVMGRKKWNEAKLQAQITKWAAAGLIQGMEVTAQSNNADHDQILPRVAARIRQTHPKFIGSVGSDSHGKFQPSRSLGFGRVDADHPTGNLVSELGTYAVVEAIKAAAGVEERGTPITKKMAAGIVRDSDWKQIDDAQRGQVVDQIVADLAAHGYTRKKYKQHRDLILGKGAPAQPASFADFPTVRDGKPGINNEEQRRLLELGSRPEVLNKMGIIIAAGGEGTRLLKDAIKDGLLPADGLAFYTKPTAPVTPVTGTSTLVYQLQTLADEAATRNVPLPVRVILHEEVGTKVAEMIKQNGNFGLPHLELVYAGMNAALDSKGRIVLRDDGTVSMNPDGTGGVVRAALQNGGDRWFESILGSDAQVALINGDMLLEPELVHLVAGAGRETPVVGVGYAYPPEREKKEEGTPGDHKAKLGTFGVLEQAGRKIVKIVEYRERGSVAGFDTAVKQEEANDEMVIARKEIPPNRVQANSGLYGFPLEGLLERTLRLPPHHQKDKDALGVTGKVQKVEEFATDIPAEYPADQVGVLSVDPAILTPIKDPAGLKKVREIAIARDRQRAEALGITLSPEARVEFHPAMNRPGRVVVGKDVHVEGAGIYIHPGGVDLYTKPQPDKPWEPFDPQSVVHLWPAQQGQPVVIPDEVVFSADGVTSAGLEQTVGTRLQSPVTSTVVVSGTRVVVISAQEARRFPELAGLEGRPPTRVGDSWLVVPSEQVGLEEFSDWLASFMALSNVSFLTFGEAGQFDRLNAMVGDLVPVLGPWALRGTWAEVLRQLAANLAGLDESEVSGEQIFKVESALGLRTHV